MTPEVPAGMGGFFQGMIGDLIRLMKTDAPLQWELALQLAGALAAEGEPAGNIEPKERIRLESLGRVAELHVADVTGMTTTPSGRPAVIAPVGRAEWARRSLEDWRPLFEKVAAALTPEREAPVEKTEPDFAEEDQEAELSAFLNQWSSALAPAMTAMQIGSIVGHLSRHALGQYDLLLPRPDRDEILVIAGNGRAFAEDWSLPADDAALYLAVRDVALHTVLTRSHVRARLDELVVSHARSFRPDRHALESLLGEASSDELGDIGALTRMFSDPAALGALADSAELRQANAELTTLVAAIVGYVGHVVDTVAERAIGARLPVREAMRRRRAERFEDEKAAEALLGLRADQEVYERGESFIKGVLERNGERDLSTLFVIEANLPTPPEMDAPGLWLERIHLPTEPDETD